MMSLWFVLSASHLFLAVVTVVESQRSGNINYPQPYICALKGSTVTMTFTYRFNFYNQPNHIFWSKEKFRKPWNSHKATDLSAEPEYSFRVQYFNENDQDFSMRLSNVTEEDQGNYYGVVRTKSGRYLNSKDLQVEMISYTVFEGDNVILTCKTTCSLTKTPTFTWYKQGHGLILPYSEELYLTSVSQENAGSYSCGVMGQTYRSPHVTLNIHYSLKSIFVSISPYGDIVEGSSVTLTCSSNANLPVYAYAWYRGSLFLSAGQSYFITQISSVDSGEYKCEVISQYGRKYSDSTILNVIYPPKSISVSISPSTEIVEGSSVTLTCSSDANPPVHSYTWYKLNESSPVGFGQSYSFTLSSSSIGWFYCEARNKLGSQRSTAVPIILNIVQPGLRDVSAPVKCAYCQQQIITMTQPTNGLLVWTVFGILLVCGDTSVPMYTPYYGTGAIQPGVQVVQSGSSQVILQPQRQVVMTQPVSQPAMVIQPSGSVRVYQPSSPALRVIQPSAPAVSVYQSSAPAVRVIQPSAPAVSVYQSSAPAVRVIQPSAPAVSVYQSSAPAVRVIQPSAPALDVLQPLAPAVRVVQPSANTMACLQVALPLVGDFLKSYPLEQEIEPLLQLAKVQAGRQQG
ncbi:B-cell receptor CD22 [Bagarius yarrelli]|uniref:B-cell receptor CD22 n=1 Tax=Bagarius yarrelli TaxID=175774 RepID=A0A556TL49_BAGYA|nr:B-cell receptor CD22 [Bagarius yarrelli]